nr:MAG TPA: hypothetical protein [Crassvirales sp.]
MEKLLIQLQKDLKNIAKILKEKDVKKDLYMMP